MQIAVILNEVKNLFFCFRCEINGERQRFLAALRMTTDLA